MENYDISNFYTVVEEFRASHMKHFHVNDIYVVHMEDIDRFMRSIWGEQYYQNMTIEAVHQPSESMRYHIRMPRRIMEVISIGS